MINMNEHTAKFATDSEAEPQPGYSGGTDVVSESEEIAAMQQLLFLQNMKLQQMMLSIFGSSGGDMKFFEQNNTNGLL